MQPPKTKGDLALETPWFQVFKRTVPGFEEPYYTIHTCDFAVVVALNSKGELLLVRQFRPAVEMVTLELPSGHVEKGETPEQAARKELAEETGHEADTLELLAVLSPSTARFTNRMWIFFAPDVRLAAHPLHPREPGVDYVYHRGDIPSLLLEKQFITSGGYAALFAAAAKGKITLQPKIKKTEILQNFHQNNP